MANTTSDSASIRTSALNRIMPRQAPLKLGMLLGVVTLSVTVWFVPQLAFGLASNALFVGFLALAFLKLPYMTADYLEKNARDEDTPAYGIFLVVLIVVVASVVSLILALNSGGAPDLAEVVVGVASVLLGWFTVQAMGAFHYAYEYYQAPESGTEPDKTVEGGLEFPGRDRPDGTAFMYFSYTIGASVATSDTKVTSNDMRRRVGVHVVFSHLYNTIILASAVNVVMSLGSSGG